MAKFKALVVTKAEQGQSVAVQDFDEADLMDGDVTVRVTHSTVNYKDGLALTGKAPVIRRWPMIPGIDFAGRVETSEHPDFKPGDLVSQLLPGNLAHIVIVSDLMSEDGAAPMVIHNIGAGVRRENRLFEFEITGRYRFAGT